MTHYQSDFHLLHGSFRSIRGNLFCVVSVSGAMVAPYTPKDVQLVVWLWRPRIFTNVCHNGVLKGCVVATRQLWHELKRDLSLTVFVCLYASCCTIVQKHLLISATVAINKIGKDTTLISAFKVYFAVSLAKKFWELLGYRPKDILLGDSIIW